MTGFTLEDARVIALEVHDAQFDKLGAPTSQRYAAARPVPHAAAPVANVLRGAARLLLEETNHGQ